MGAPKDSPQTTAMVRFNERRSGLVQNFVRTENSDLASKKYNKISGQVTLTGLYTEANPYTFPNDGYLRLSIGAAATTVYYKLMGAAGSTTNVPEMTITSDSGRVLLYVRAGMRWGVSSGNEDKLTAIYAPLNYA